MPGSTREYVRHLRDGRTRQPRRRRPHDGDGSPTAARTAAASSSTSGAGVALGHRRLAIIDLVAAGAPADGQRRRPVVWSLTTARSTTTASCAHELEATRPPLPHRDATPRSCSHAYDEWGTGCVDAAATACSRSRSGTRGAARCSWRATASASSRSTTRRSGGGSCSPRRSRRCSRRRSVEPELDRGALLDYSDLPGRAGPLTMFAGVEKLPPAHCVVSADGNLRSSATGTVASRRDRRRTPRRRPPGASSRQLLDGAVERRLVSDVPVGAFLSGGLDSNSIVAAMSARTRTPVRTYTIAFHPRHRAGDVTLDDPAVAARAAAHYGSRHTEMSSIPTWRASCRVSSGTWTSRPPIRR